MLIPHVEHDLQGTVSRVPPRLFSPLSGGASSPELQVSQWVDEREAEIGIEAEEPGRLWVRNPASSIESGVHAASEDGVSAQLGLRSTRSLRGGSAQGVGV